MKIKYIDTVFETIMIIFFFCIILAPPLKTIFSPHQIWSKTEKRKLHEFPQFPKNLSSFNNFKQQFEDYYNDNFGFREILISRYQIEMKYRLGKAGSPYVVIGKDGWLYPADWDVFKDYQGMLHLTNEELEGFIKEQNMKAEWLNKKGIRYLLFYAPNKQSIYPEYLPENIKVSRGITKYEQLLSYTNNDLSYMLDIHTTLRNSKGNQNLYYKTDLHWNMYGAYIAFRHVMDKIQQWYPNEQFKTEFSVINSQEEQKGGDLANILTMSDTLTEKRPFIEKYDRCAKIDKLYKLNFQLHNFDRNVYDAPLQSSCSSANLKALIFGDSFSGFIYDLFTENFRQTIYLRSKYDQDHIEQLIDFFHPDIVIEEIAEHYLFYKEKKLADN
jgi:hypothetical protein